MPNLRAQASMHARQGQRLKRWEHESVLDKMQARLDHMPEAMTIRRQTVALSQMTESSLRGALRGNVAKNWRFRNVQRLRQ